MKEQNMNERTGGRIFTPLFMIVMLLNLAASVTMQFFNSTYSLHMDSLNRSATVAGLVVSVGALTATIYCFFGGALANRIGRRKLITAGFILYGLMSVVIAAVQPLPAILPVRILQMLGYSMASTTISVAVVDVLPGERMGEGIGYYGMAANLATALGPSIALGIQGNYGFMMLMLVSCAVCMAAAALSGFGLSYEKETGSARNGSAGSEVSGSSAADGGRYTGVWRFIEKSALVPSILNLLISVTTMLITLYLFLFANRAGISGAGAYFTISVLFMVGVRLFSGRLSDRKGVLYALLPGILSLVICFLLLIICSGHPFLFFLSAVFEGTGVGMATPALNAEAVRKAPKDRTGIASSTFFMSMGIVVVIASLFWGYMIDHFAFAAVYMTAIAILAVSAAAGTAAFRKR